MEEVAIISAVRTPIGKFGGSLKNIPADILGALTVKEAVRRGCISAQEVDSIILGNVLQAGLGQNPARQIAVNAGIPYEAPAMTINEVCGSGLKSVILGSQQIRLGEADVVVVGGTENMSRAPFLLPDHRWGNKLGNSYLIDSILKDGLIDAFGQNHMGATAEILAEKFRITREEQDQFALQSQIKAGSAIRSNKFNEEIMPVKLKYTKGIERTFSEDEYVRQDTTMESLQKLRPAFVENGTVTAGNSSGLNDGAAALVLMRKSLAKSRKIPYFATIKGYTEIGMDPSLMGYAPFYSIRKLIDKIGITLDDIDLFEINEAFASQMIAVIRNLHIDAKKVNVNGGAIALGHPIGATGARILVTLLYEMQKRKAHLGLVSLCVGGGIGISMIVEN